MGKSEPTKTVSRSFFLIENLDIRREKCYRRYVLFTSLPKGGFLVKNIIAYLKSQEHLLAAEQDLTSLTCYGLDMIQDVPLRTAVTEFMDNETPMDFYCREAVPEIARPCPSHHADRFGMLRSVVERLIMTPAIAPHIEGMCGHGGTVDALALDVALAATLISDTQYYGLLNILKGKRGNHAEYAAYAWQKFHPKTNPSITERAVAERVADAALFHHSGKDIVHPPSHIRPEMRLVALVNAFCTSKAIDAIYWPLIVTIPI